MPHGARFLFLHIACNFILAFCAADEMPPVPPSSQQIVGRLAAQIAPIIRGKHKPTFCPNDDCGDVVVVVNAGAVEFTGDKWQKKVWFVCGRGNVGGCTAQATIASNGVKLLVLLCCVVLQRTPLLQLVMSCELFCYFVMWPLAPIDYIQVRGIGIIVVALTYIHVAGYAARSDGEEAVAVCVTSTPAT